MNYEHPQLLEKLAGDYVLGTMSARVRRRFSHILRDSFAAQRAVADWQGRLEPLSASIAPVMPPDRVWRAIDRRTRPAPAARRWHTFLAGALKPALGLCLGIVVTLGALHQAPGSFGLQKESGTLAASYVGLLTDATGAPAVSASSLRRGKLLSIKVLKPLAIPAHHVAQLWALPKDGKPIPIGVVPANGKVDIALAAAAEDMFANVPQLAVSFEPAAAASSPSGVFVLRGHCIKVW
jgi:anti-sigma-K factor RskA